MKNNIPKKILNKGLNYFILMTACIIIAFLLMLSVFSMPVDKMWDNVNTSIQTFEQEGLYFRVQETPSSMLDNFSDSFMVNNVITSGENGIIDNAMNNYRVIVENGNNIQALRAYTQGDEYSLNSHARYWHGYLVFLKPLFLLFNYSQIRSINTFFQITLICTICMGLVMRNKSRFCIPLIVTWYTLCPLAVMHSLQFSSVFYITFIACLIIVCCEEYLQGKYIYFFLVIGALTSFFDLLSYPVLTFLLPLSFLFIIRDSKSEAVPSATIDIVAYGMSWGIAYGTMWASKWIIATILTDNNVILNALNKVKLRTSSMSSANEVISRTTGLEKCIEALLTPPVQFVIVICLIASFLILIKNRRYFSINFASIYAFFLISCIPIVWLIFTNNHSTIHYWFTYRNLAASVFALFSGILVQINKPAK